MSAPDDLSTQLQRFLRPGAPPRSGRTPVVPPPTGVESPRGPSADGQAIRTTITTLGDAVRQDFEELHDQLEVAFEELDERIDGLRRQQEVLTRNAEAQNEGLQHSADLGARVLEQLDVVHLSLGDLAARIPTSDRPVGDDGHIDELTAQVADGRTSLEEKLADLAREVTRLRAVPVQVDLRSLEDAVRGGMLHNAADISTLHRDVETLTEAVRLQDKGLSELRTTLDWIKERLLLR